MDCEGIIFSEPIPSFLDNDDVFDDIYQELASWDGAKLAEDADFTGLMSSEPAVNGPSVIAGGLQDSNDQGLESMAPLVSGVSLKEMSAMNSLFIDDIIWELRVGEHSNSVEACLNNFLFQDPPERNEFQSFPVDPVAVYVRESAPCSDPPETDQFQTFTDPMNTHAANCAPCLDFEYAYESALSEVRSSSGQSLQSYLEPVEPHFISVSPEGVWVNTEEYRHEHRDCFNILACIICGNYTEFQIVRSCGHSFCQQYCRETWLQDKGQACSDCWYTADEDVNAANQVYGGPEVDCGSNLEYKTDYAYAQEFIIHQQGYQPGLAPAQDLDIMGYSVQRETEELNQAVGELTLEYQPVLQEAGREYFHETLPNEAVAEWGQPIMLIDLSKEIPSTSKQSEQPQGNRKRERVKLVVDHNGVAMRYDGSEERFTAYYRPSYWTENDASVFLGEYPTHEEAVDAHNLVALLHEGKDARIILPYTADRYIDELKRWEGKHHVDLVCELRLRGRGSMKDGAINYKHVGRRWSGKKKGTRYFSTVSDDLVSSSIAKRGKPKRTFLTTFDTPEQAAQHADQVLVKRKGPAAWTNFPLSSYITAKDELPLSFLPISQNFRDNLTYKRSKPDVAFS